MAVAEAHGLDGDPIAALSFAVGAGSLAWLGRFDEAEEWLALAQRALRPDESPGTELAVHHASGLLRLGQGRLPEALEAFHSAEKMQAMLSSEHGLMLDVRMRILLTQVRMGESQAAYERLERINERDRERAEVRIPAAAFELAQERPETAIELLAPVVEQTAPTLHPTWAAVHALLFDALALETAQRRARSRDLARARARAR